MSYESSLEHSSSPDGCREDCPACEDERLHEAGGVMAAVPWEVCGRTVLSKAGMVADCRPRSNYPDHGEAAANAAHIVLCVNSHDALLTALQGVLRVADRQTPEFDAARVAIRKATP